LKTLKSSSELIKILASIEIIYDGSNISSRRIISPQFSTEISVNYFNPIKHLKYLAFPILRDFNLGRCILYVI
jgi:hypothetical protein